MLEEGIFAGVILVCAFALLLAIWGLWHCLSWYKKQPSDTTQPLILQIEADEVFDCEASGLERGQTLKRKTLPNLQPKDNNRGIKVSQVFESGGVEKERKQAKPNQSGSTITLEVVSGPSSGSSVTCYSGQALTIGRLPSNSLIVNDAEVSGSHACIKWNPQSFAWDFVDLGSLNGTYVNSQPVSFDQSNGSSTRKPSIAIELSTGDVVLLGSSSRVLVQINDIANGSRSDYVTTSCPIEVGVAADAMALRRGGKKLPMEDVCFYEWWPMAGLQEFGVFCIFDGHGGAAAASAASRIMPQKLYEILKMDAKRTKLLTNCDATDVLLDAFDATEEALDYEYEGCTATVLLVWLDSSQVLYAQCANVGDSACIFSVDGKYISMTEDHRLTSISERSRMLEMGKQIREGETRLCGMNIARVLGDKFLKEQDARFSSKPFVSEVLQITQDSKAVAVIASDGLWDVLSQRRAVQLALEAKEERYNAEGTELKPLSAKSTAEMLINKARALRTKDNTTVIILDFVISSNPDLRT